MFSDDDDAFELTATEDAMADMAEGMEATAWSFGDSRPVRRLR